MYPLTHSYVLLIGFIYYVLSSGVSEFLMPYPRVYYILLGGLIDFKVVNWFIYVFLFFMGVFAMVCLFSENHFQMSRNLTKKKCCYPRYLHVRSPAPFYRMARSFFLVACVLTCLISPDLTMGILLFLFIFSNLSNIWNFQVWYSAIISAIKIGVCLLFSVPSPIVYFYR